MLVVSAREKDVQGRAAVSANIVLSIFHVADDVGDRRWSSSMDE